MANETDLTPEQMRALGLSAGEAVWFRGNAPAARIDDVLRGAR